jgi:hypothetical protein
MLYMQVEWWVACIQNFREKASFELSTWRLNEVESVTL